MITTTLNYSTTYTSWDIPLYVRSSANSAAYAPTNDNTLCATRPRASKTPESRVPWSWLHDDIQFVAMDKDGSWWGFKTEPFREQGSEIWTFEGSASEVMGLSCLKLPTDIKWEDSKMQRPEEKLCLAV